MGNWCNKRKVRWEPTQIEKPCLKCEFCPYGPLVEEMPMRHDITRYNCKLFEHDCPVYYHAEMILESDAK